MERAFKNDPLGRKGRTIFKASVAMIERLGEGVEEHISRFDQDVANQNVIKRLRDIPDGKIEIHGHPNPSEVEAMYSWRPRQGTVGWEDFVTKMRGNEDGGPVVSVRSSALSNEARALNTIAHESYELSGIEEALGNSRMSVEKVCKVRDEMHFKANDYADELTMRIYERGN